MTEADHLAFMRRTLARNRVQSAQLEAQKRQQSQILAEEYRQRMEEQAAQRKEERQRTLAQLKARAQASSPTPEPLEAEQDPEVSALLQRRPSLRQRLRVVPSVKSLSKTSRSSSPRKPRVPPAPRPKASQAKEAEVPSAQQPQMPRKEHLRATQHQLLKSCGVVIYKQQMKEHFKRIAEAVEVGYGASAGLQKSILSNLARPVLSERSRAP
ncbi:unnamed protein product [Effrenium voratum]|nr:unnamed protein product [Effrenium voratum]CAJ1397485.1 unnamed protein product [Effrenium voratum]CAJ1414990.1 unnamed protein product [Effrenium voratum]